MARDKTRDLRKMGRRNFVKTLSAMGVSGAALKYMTKDALAKYTDDPKDEIPRLERLETPKEEMCERGVSGTEYIEANIERKPVYYTIPRDKWVTIETAYDAASRLSERLKRRKAFGGGSITVGVTTTTSGHKRRKSVRVTHSTVKRKGYEQDDEGGEVRITYEEDAPEIEYDELVDMLPGSIDGSVGSGEYEETVEDIPVIHRKIVEEEQSSFTDEYRPVVGGCQFRPNRYLPPIGTLGTPAIDYERGEPVMVTAAHVVDDDLGDLMYQPGGIGAGIGYQDRTAYNPPDTGDDIFYDVATIDLTEVDTPVSAEWHLADYGGGKYGDIDGTICEDALKDKYEGNTNEDLWHQGRTTGRKSGYVDEIVPSDHSGGLGVVEADGFDTDDGDSGGPYWVTSEDDIYIAGIHARSRPRGNMMWDVEQFWDIEVLNLYPDC